MSSQFNPAFFTYSNLSTDILNNIFLFLKKNLNWFMSLYILICSLVSWSTLNSPMTCPFVTLLPTAFGFSWSTHPLYPHLVLVFPKWAVSELPTTLPTVQPPSLSPWPSAVSTWTFPLFWVCLLSQRFPFFSPVFFMERSVQLMFSP